MKKAFAIVIAVWIAACVLGCAPAEGSSGGQEAPAFSVGDTQIVMNAPAQPVLEALGEPLSSTEEPSCAFTGLDRTYYYGSFYLSTCPTEDGDRISGLWFADDSVATAEGIRIGSTQAEVEAAYGAEHFNGVSSYVLSREGSCLTVILTDGVVSGIRYDATTN